MSTREERLELRMQKDASYKRPNQPAIAAAVAHIARAASMRGKMAAAPGKAPARFALPGGGAGGGGGGGGGGSGGGGVGRGHHHPRPRTFQPRRSSTCSNYKTNAVVGNSLSGGVEVLGGDDEGDGGDRDDGDGYDDDVFRSTTSPVPPTPTVTASAATMSAKPSSANLQATSANHAPTMRTREELLMLQEIREKAREQERLEREREQERMDREDLVPDSKKAPQVRPAERQTTLYAAPH